MKVLVNDQIIERSAVTVDVEDRGFQFGDGVYEVVRVYGGTFFTMDEHLARLERSAREIQMELPMSIAEIKEKLQILITEENINDGIVYIQVNRGVAGRVHHFPAGIKATLFAYASHYPRNTEVIEGGGSAVLVEDIRWLRCDIKSLNLLGNVLAKQKAKEAGALEAIQHRGNIITEGSSTNVYMVKNGTLYTHPATNLILNGITRQVILDIAKKAQIPVVEEAVTIEQLLDADEVMISSTTQELTPILSVDGKQIGDGKPGPVTKKIQEHFQTRIFSIRN